MRPPDDFKMSVLAGLDPATIIECPQMAITCRLPHARRYGIRWKYWTPANRIFWLIVHAYISGFEATFSLPIKRPGCNFAQAEDIGGVLVLTGAPPGRRRCPACESELLLASRPWKLRYKARSIPPLQPENLADVLTDLINDRQTMDQKYADLFNQYQEKSKKQQQTQKLYNALKQKVQVEKMGAVANNDVDQSLHSINVIGAPARMQDGRESREGWGEWSPKREQISHQDRTCLSSKDVGALQYS
jgi:hypothetical protein